MRFMKLESSDGRVVWVDTKRIVYVIESEHMEGCSRIVFEDQTWVEIKGSPDELMMH